MGEIILFKSSRYNESALIEFAHKYQWEHVASIDGLDATFQFYEDMAAESRAIFAQLSPEGLMKKSLTPAGTPITTWKWLRALLEHEIHHRGQLYLYLAMQDIATPPLYGLTSEQVIEASPK